MIWRLIQKDWYFARWPLAGYLALGLISVAGIASKTPIIHYAGFVVLLSTVVVMGAQLVFGSVLPERRKQTMAFVMSLPLSHSDYTASKLVGGIGMYLILWLLIAGSLTLVVMANDHLPDGVIPFATILLLYLFIAFVLTLSVALVSESEPWTIVVTTVCNISISIVLFAIIGIPGIGTHMQSAAPVWNQTAISIIALEIGLIAVLVGGTLFLQSRKTDFV